MGDDALLVGITAAGCACEPGAICAVCQDVFRCPSRTTRMTLDGEMMDLKGDLSVTIRCAYWRGHGRRHSNNMERVGYNWTEDTEVKL